MAAAASEEGAAIPVAIPHRIVSTNELLSKFTHYRRSYWLAWIQHRVLLRDNERNLHFDESQSEFLEHMAFYNAEMNFLTQELSERDVPAPSRNCTVVSLFLEPDDDNDQQAAPSEGPIPIQDLEEGIPLRASLEASWERIDCAYYVAWVLQNIFLMRFPNATDDEINDTPHVHHMMIRGRALQIVEQRLMRMGWQRPPPRMVHTLFPMLALDL
jgi:hypothetical protein